MAPLLAPTVAAAGIAYAYGPGIDPAWELSRSMAVSERMVLLVRASARFDIQLQTTTGLLIVADVIGGVSRAADDAAVAGPAQQAVISALTGLTAQSLATAENHRPGAPAPFGVLLPTPGSPAAAAGQFATLPAAAQHAWLIQHLAALKAGRVSLAQPP